MSELPRLTTVSAARLQSLDPATPLAEKGPHYTWIKDQAPDWLTQASLQRLHPLNDLTVQRPTWYAAAGALEHHTLKQLNAEAWRLQNAVDAKLGPVQDVYAFAEPLLKRAINDRYGLDLDVKTTFLRIYTPKQLPWYALDLSNGVTSRSVSLLDAALHNFASGERFEQHSCYISKPDYRGHFQILRHDRRMSLEQFKTLCRELDLGSLYQRHLNDCLATTEPVAQALFKPQVIASQKAALKAAAFMALTEEKLGAGAYAVITGVLDGTEKRAHFYQLNLLDTPLNGILLIARDLEHISSVSKLIAYIPHDPETPVKEYDSSTAFMQDLTRKLQLNRLLPSSKQVSPTTYQQFFSQFVPHARRGVFFAELTERLYRVQWHERDTQDPAPAWCEEAVNTPKLQFKGVPIVGELWEQLYQSALNKILNDGRNLVVSTAQADNDERWAWWENVLKIGADLLNVALLVVTPFVPLLGELMLAYTAYQLADDVFEGIVDFSEGQALEATQHVIAVVTDVLQLSAMAGGGILAKELLFKPSPFVNRLKPVQVGDKTRLWNPELAPYARNDLALPAEAKPDKSGLYDHQGQKVVRLDDQHFVVEHDAERNTHRVTHPTRPAAYSPAIEANGSGAWVHEGEDPWTWDDAQLRKRLGHATAGLSADEVAQACDISDTQPGALRKMYLNLEPTPPLLEDSLSRLRSANEARKLPEQVRGGAPTGDWFTWAAQMTTERPGWPSDKAIRVFNNAELTGNHLSYGSRRGDAQTLDISHQDVSAGQLAPRLNDFLPPVQLEALLPEPLPDTAEARIQALRDQMADDLDRNRIATFNHLYRGQHVLDSAPARLLQQQFPQLPAELVQRLMQRSYPKEIAAMTDEQRIPLRVKNLAWELQNEATASHAFEGFYNDDLLSADTERMALNTLRQHSDALGERRITVRDQRPDGAIRSQAGPQDAAEKTLLRLDNGRYAIDEPGSQSVALHYDFFEALLRVLPEGKTDYVPGQGRLFKGWLKDRLLSSAARRHVLEPVTLRQVDRHETQTLLQKPMFNALRSLLGGNASTPQALETRMRRLCPLMSDTQAQSVLLELQSESGQHRLRQLESEKSA
ncbi:dermonecrotic toxin domain-containing protein [Pseudomonas sp. S1_E04]